MWISVDEMVKGETYQVSETGAPWVFKKMRRNGDLEVEYSSGPQTLTHRQMVWKPEEELNTMESNMPKKDQLYEITQESGVTYGNYLATNSKSEYVMEEKGTGKIIIVSKDYIQEVLPHSITIRFDDSERHYSFLAEAGKFELGFYVMSAQYGFQIVEVIKLDSKAKNATKEFKPIGKLNLEAV